MKALFHLKSRQKNELLLNLIFSDSPHDNGKNTTQKKRNRVRDFFFQKGIYAPYNDGDGGN